MLVPNDYATLSIYVLLKVRAQIDVSRDTDGENGNQGNGGWNFGTLNQREPTSDLCANDHIPET
jgi:hypothetical protein